MKTDLEPGKHYAIRLKRSYCDDDSRASSNRALRIEDAEFERSYDGPEGCTSLVFLYTVPGHLYSEWARAWSELAVNYTIESADEHGRPYKIESHVRDSLIVTEERSDSRSSAYGMRESKTSTSVVRESKAVDLRSDTVTRPTPEMRDRMAAADVGDDVMGEDPTIEALQARAAEMFGKQAALFFPSGTMCNLVSVLAWCDERGSEIVVGDRSHVFLYEQAGVCQFGGVSMRTVKNLPDGSFDVENARMAIRDDEPDVHEPRTKLIMVENTHNVCGGTVLPERHLAELRELSLERRVPIHMDGARLWNALAATRMRPAEVAMRVDSISVCLSKGLGAPVGSLLIGPRTLVDRARRLRKALGGGMRQVGVLGAAAMQALDDFEVDDGALLREDHRRAAEIAAAIGRLRIFLLPRLADETVKKTNIVFFRTVDAEVVRDRLRERGVLVSVWSPGLLRIVVHRDVDDDGVRRTIEALEEVTRLA